MWLLGVVGRFSAMATDLTCSTNASMVVLISAGLLSPWLSARWGGASLEDSRGAVCKAGTSKVLSCLVSTGDSLGGRLGPLPACDRLRRFGFEAREVGVESSVDGAES
jgi:hypothetical protein